MAAVALVLGFCWLGWWQWERATSPMGDARSYGYALQWPVFAAFVVFMWMKMIRDEPRSSDSGAGEVVDAVGHSAQERTLSVAVAAEDDEDDEELAAYNRYLAGLNARAGRVRQ